VKRLLIDTCAKVNLCLRVLNRRPDGFHNVETVYQTIDVRDEIELVACGAPGEITLAVRGEPAPADETNLCWRAARLLAERARSAPGVSIRLAKSIPAGAGLGGGSSDAAAVLVGLPRLWGIELAPEVVQAAAAQLGADVPFFMRGGCCLGLGKGERLECLPTAPLALVVVVPARRVATTQAYAALRRGASLRRPKGLGRVATRMLAAVRAADPAAVAAALHNDFEATAMVGVVEALEAKAALTAAGCLGALLSGSGSAVFGIAPDAAAAARIAAGLRGRWPWVRATRAAAAEESMLVTEWVEAAAC
jgi:4-diphosphocytidyl-2-C-methyl-D-erythritol kinase